MTKSLFTRLAAAAALIALPFAPAHAEEQSIEAAFDAAFTARAAAPQMSAPQVSSPVVQAPRASSSSSSLIPVTRQPMAASYRTPLEQQIALLAEDSRGRIGVAAVDLATGQSVSVLGNQAFPMASTSKIAIVATFLEQVDQGRLSLTSEFPISGSQFLPAHQLIDMVITRSSNPATDALLRAVGGVGPVNAWAQRAGIADFNLTRDIATLVREDGRVDPASYIDLRDSSTPQAMVDLLTGIYQGRWLTPESRRVIISAMERCRTGTRRIPAMMPAGVTVAHKTGSLNNTSSDIGIITGPDGRSIAVAIYVTGQGTRAAREARIASIARAIYDGFTDTGRVFANASYGSTGS
ncbi:MAG TPA: serine hydrolase [Burkholderiaceae bacterium]